MTILPKVTSGQSVGKFFRVAPEPVRVAHSASFNDVGSIHAGSEDFNLIPYDSGKLMISVTHPYLEGPPTFAKAATAP